MRRSIKMDGLDRPINHMGLRELEPNAAAMRDQAQVHTYKNMSKKYFYGINEFICDF